jgi:transcription elongation factor GreB
LTRDRARAEADAGDDERARVIATLTARLAALDARIACAHVVDPASQPRELRDQVRFGATVQARAADGTRRRLTIVGVDEADAAAGLIAFVAPLARAFSGLRVGDVAHVRSPRGLEEWEILAIDYGP